ncbi:MAG: 50S ribosomal protein L7/L12 [Acidobacteria bacterium]|nr:50S ribosomal protein L7/L12 [Acidobacteriota bacterium]MXW72469.1 50S ribosomal protein L7/L12 [Acidobacteriota bacterium]MXX87384.1 50S ribosomal protein L7/L12 [Acidobacteriota bacterium]MXZ61935.1 50S ribosomal protein L7/L12 [Acidobacteriota bacterium]MYA45974.1 50S ribosomal protein L7/L12 [Acidobacteriota bacterium]
MSQQDVVNHIKQLTVLELSELVKALEDELGVSAAAAMPVAVAAGGGEAAPVEEQTEFDAVLTETGPNRVQVIKAVRELTSLGLREAKTLVEEAPKAVKEAIPMEEAKAIQERFKEVGATIEIK